MRIADIPEIENLSTLEKILFIEDLWDRISVDEENIPIPQSHKDELDKRFRRSKSNPGTHLSLSELQERIDQRK